jgi:hypothetical protein
MKAAIIAGCVVLSVLHAPGAYAGERTTRQMVTVTKLWAGMPPAAFDIPYPGELRIWLVQSKKDMRGFCPWAAANQDNWSGTACTHVSRDQKYCDIYLLKNDKDSPVKRSIELRHELAHCNGWGTNHINHIKVPADRDVKMPTLPPGTVTLRAYPPLVCLTPDGKEEPCEARKPDGGNPWANSVENYQILKVHPARPKNDPNWWLSCWRQGCLDK